MATLRQLAQVAKIEFGTAIEAGYYFGSIAAAPAAYRTIAAAEFSQIAGAWDSFMFGLTETSAGVYDYTKADEYVAFAQANAQKVWADGIFAGPNGYYPAWLTGGGYTPAQLAVIQQNHINSWFAHFGSSLDVCLVANECFEVDGSGYYAPILCLWNSTPESTAWIEQAFIWAAAARSPGTKLYYNDFAFEFGGDKANIIRAWVSSARSRGVPIDGMGFQCHWNVGDVTTVNLAALRSNIESFRALDVEVQITELDIGIADNTQASLDAQREAYRRVVETAILAGVKGITTWGFTDAVSWRAADRPLLYDASYVAKPSYYGVAEALTNTVPEFISAVTVGVGIQASAPTVTASRSVYQAPSIFCPITLPAPVVTRMEMASVQAASATMPVNMFSPAVRVRTVGTQISINGALGSARWWSGSDWIPVNVRVGPY